jgi:hypothetical protein
MEAGGNDTYFRRNDNITLKELADMSAALFVSSMESVCEERTY